MKTQLELRPASLKRTIVEVRYISTLPFEVVFGLFFSALDDTYSYSNDQETNNTIPFALKIVNQNELNIRVGPSTLFYNEKINFEIQSGIIVFNCIDRYIGWPEYLGQISKVLEQLFKPGLITSFTRVGIRYISEFPNIDLIQITKFNFQFGFPEIKSESFTFSSVFSHKEHNIRLIIKNNQQKKATEENDIIDLYSQIDLDVFKTDLEINQIDDLLKLIDVNHSIQKDVFFQLFIESYLDYLDPNY